MIVSAFIGMWNLLSLIVSLFITIFYQPTSSSMLRYLSQNWYLYGQTQKKHGAQPGKKWLVYFGLSSNILTLMFNIAFWISYLKSSPRQSCALFIDD